MCRASRKRLGLLEKHKDYVARAKDFHRKEVRGSLACAVICLHICLMHCYLPLLLLHSQNEGARMLRLWDSCARAYRHDDMRC